MNAISTKLSPEEIEIAQKIWTDLREGAADAHEQLNAASESIRTAILEALVEAMHARKTTSRPFG